MYLCNYEIYLLRYSTASQLFRPALPVTFTLFFYRLKTEFSQHIIRVVGVTREKTNEF